VVSVLIDAVDGVVCLSAVALRAEVDAAVALADFVRRLSRREQPAAPMAAISITAVISRVALMIRSRGWPDACHAIEHLPT
jgi:hypothetical protein